MTTKLSLTLKESTAQKIKEYAEKQHTSVSKIAEEYFSRLTEESNKPMKSLVEEFAGIATQPISNIETEREHYLLEKYGK